MEQKLFGDFQYSGSNMQAPLPDAPKQPAQSAGQGPKEGAVGIYRTDSAWRELPKGVSKNTGRYYAHIMRKCKLYSKSFPGTDEGLREAVEWRKGMEEKLK